MIGSKKSWLSKHTSFEVHQHLHVDELVSLYLLNLCLRFDWKVTLTCGDDDGNLLTGCTGDDGDGDGEDLLLLQQPQQRQRLPLRELAGKDEEEPNGLTGNGGNLMSCLAHWVKAKALEVIPLVY